MISKSYPSLIFDCFAFEGCYGGFDARTIIVNGAAMIDESHLFDSVHSFIGRYSKVINTGYLVVTHDNWCLKYLRKNINTEAEDYDPRDEDEDTMTILLEDEYGNIHVEPMNSVERFSSWKGDIEILRQFFQEISSNIELSNEY
jgi:hypothetical protein